MKRLLKVFLEAIFFIFVHFTNVVAHCPVYFPSLVDCDGFGPLGHSSGGRKDSQITTSSSQIKTLLPYSAKLQANLSGWSPRKASEGELHDVHFIQFDLKDVVRTKFMVSMHCSAILS